MARPMLLMQRETLNKLWLSHAEGVPISTLIQKHELRITPPTLTKLISYMTALESTTNTKVAKIIDASLFPKWLDEAERTDPIVGELDVRTVVQPSRYRYEGKMPLGKWVLNDWAKS